MCWHPGNWHVWHYVWPILAGVVWMSPNTIRFTCVQRCHSSYNAKSIWNRGNFGSIKPAVKCIAYVCLQPRGKTSFVHKGLWCSVGVSAAANCLIWNLLGESWVQKFFVCARKHFCWGPNLKLGCNSLPHFSTDTPASHFRRVCPHALSQTFVSF